ncbi:prolyl oligopeptidase family serine peptidase [Clostridium cadaveris]|uniref:prolyl oligopeptidase family serine peptidase n=1 Tax=Clostridium cadaveris TaxID=1529 RepID=UPI000C07E24E|nr:prolyl oligopeptidase family serine peptidase [Clostridium cadaveris]
MKLKRMISSIVCLTLIAGFNISAKAEESKNGEEKFKVITEVFDFGPQTTKIVIDTNKEIDGSTVNKNTFKVLAKNEINDNKMKEINREVVNAYVTDKELGEVAPTGKYITLELKYGMNVDGAGILLWNNDKFSNEEVKLNYVVTQENDMKTKDGQELTKNNTSYVMNGVKNLLVDDFSKGKSKSGLNYRYFSPAKDDKKNPLVIWLHGAGEGGLSNTTQISANRGAIAFATKESQNIFGGAYVLAPQTPSYWMPSFMVGDLELVGEKDYTPDVVSLIKEFIKENPDVDASRVYIGGCSMGGYQTIQTVAAAPELFAAAFPICPAYEPKEDELKRMSSVPTWLTHVATDPTAPVSNSQISYKTLKNFGGDVFYTEYETVERDGNVYDSHASWIYTLQNDPVNEKGQHIFNWLADQKLKSENKTNQNNNIAIYTVVSIVVVGLGIVLFMKKKNNK